MRTHRPNPIPPTRSPALRRRLARPARGFTLVELLVVIGIIAILLSVLMPVLSDAREAARATRCLSNVKQIAMAMLMYVGEQRGYLPPTSSGNEVFNINGTNQTIGVRWYGGAYGSGGVTGGTYYPDCSPLAAYWGTANIGGCPDFSDIESLIRPGYGDTDYAYNNYCGTPPPGVTAGSGQLLTSFINPSEKAVIWDSARIINGATVDRTPWGYPTSGNPNTTPPTPDPNFHGRHGGGTGNVGYLDGHAAAVHPFYFSSYPNGGPNAALDKKNNIGNIDDDGNLNTDEHYAPSP